MSNIYIQEPPTNGKVLLQTTVGDIDIELWSKEAPKAATNFVQLCMEGYYNGTIFHRIVKGFIVQGGDPTGTGMGGESIYGQPFKDEFHTRLRFVRRGLVACANSEKDDNGSQFFFTLGPSPELQGKHTIFGKVTGNTLYNMLKLEESLVDHNDRPLYPHKIIAAKVVSNPFPDIVPRVLVRNDDEMSKEKKNQAKGTKNFSLLSFGEEAEEEEAEDDAVAREFRGKSKSSHDLANDPKLSSVPAVSLDENENPDLVKEGENGGGEEEEVTKDQSGPENSTLESVRKKLKKDPLDKTEPDEPLWLPVPLPPLPPPAPSVPSIEMDTDELEKKKKEIEREEVRQEIKKIQKELKEKKKASAEEEKESEPEEMAGVEEEEDEAEKDIIIEYHQEIQKYTEKKTQMLKKGQEREEYTLGLLAKFKSKMQTAKENKEHKDSLSEENEDSDDEGWMTHILRFEDEGPVIAKDANVNSADRYEISDPRNPINQRRREASKQQNSTN